MGCKLRAIARQDSHTTLFITQGESLPYVKDQLGHSSISMTVDVYGHLVPGANRQRDLTERDNHGVKVTLQ